MKKKTAFMFIGLSALVPIIISVATIGLSSKNTQAMKATGGPYELVLNGSNSPSELTDSYQDKVTTTVKTTLNNDVELGLVLAKKSSGSFATLGHRGMIYNFNSDDGRINGISSITATFSSGAAVYLKTSSQELSTNNGSGVALEDLQLLTSGSQLTLKSPAKYFALIAGDTGATINSLSINYSCSDQGIGFDALIGTYTGQANNIAYQLSFSRNGNTQKVVYKTLNQETLTQYEGTASISGNNVTSVINGVSYVSQIAQDGRLLSFVSASPDSLPHIDFYRVYNVENFENYSAAGVGYDKNNAKENTTGARSHWFADYQASGSSPVGGSSWSLMGSSDYMQFSTTGGRNNSKYAALKGNTSNPCRYIQMNAFYGVPAIAGRGSKLSFWAAGAYSNNGLTTLLSSDATVRVIAYYNTKINSTNHTVCDYQNFSITAFSGWKEYTMDLDPNKNYYSIGFVCNKGGSYLPIDDITIYTVSPYTKYVPETYPEGTFKAAASLAGKSIDIIFAIGNYDNQLIKVLASNSDAEATGISYNPSTKAITIPTTGSFDSAFGTFTYGTITGTYDSTNDKITKINCDGSIGSYLSNLTATHPTYYSPCDGSTSELQTQFKRRWNNGSWQVDTSNADRITKDDVHFVSGSGALKRRGYTGGAVALCFNSDFASAIQVQNVGFWVYNPSGSDIILRMWYYQAVNFGSNGETGSVTAKANSWTYCAMGFGTKNIYNFQIADFNNTGVYLTFDNIILF